MAACCSLPAVQANGATDQPPRISNDECQTPCDCQYLFILAEFKEYRILSLYYIDIWNPPSHAGTRRATCISVTTKLQRGSCYRKYIIDGFLVAYNLVMANCGT
jgi:hypothetical protein